MFISSETSKLAYTRVTQMRRTIVWHRLLTSFRFPNNNIIIHGNRKTIMSTESGNSEKKNLKMYKSAAGSWWNEYKQSSISVIRSNSAIPTIHSNSAEQRCWLLVQIRLHTFGFSVHPPKPMKSTKTAEHTAKFVCRYGILKFRSNASQFHERIRHENWMTQLYLAHWAAKYELKSDDW